MSTPPRILAILAGALGDFIVALPALARLADAGNLTVMGHGTRVALAPLAIPQANTLDMESAEFHTIFGEPSARLRQSLAGVDAALAWFRDEDGALARGLRAAGIPRVHTAPGLPDSAWAGHAAEYYESSVDAFLLKLDLDLVLAENIQYSALRVAPRQNHGIVLHPGSGSAKKNWPIEHFTALARQLESDGYRVSWLLGPAEEDGIVPGDAAVIREASLPALAALLAGASLFIGNDSGVSHLAAAAGCPTVAIFWATNPALWAPRGPCVRVVDGHGSPPAIDTVVACARAVLETTG